jgi:hypothetical protein
LYDDWHQPSTGNPLTDHATHKKQLHAETQRKPNKTSQLQGHRLHPIGEGFVCLNALIFSVFSASPRDELPFLGLEIFLLSDYCWHQVT